jgi:type II restriction enzyme
MADIQFYKKHFGIGSTEELLAFFLQHMKKTNRTADYFVDWRKILSKIDNDEYRDALNLLMGIRQVADASGELKRLLLKYPRTGDIVADLLGIPKNRADRTGRTLVILYENGSFRERPIIFRTRGYTNDSASTLVHFAEQSGLLEQLSRIGSIWDYAFGVEAGTDSHGRKNRSGKIGEGMLHACAQEVGKQKGLKYLHKTRPANILREKVDMPAEVFDREFDGILCSDQKMIAIEVNFYNTPGSKPDAIGDAYQTRMRECRNVGLYFAYVTDGQGWVSSRSILQHAIRNIDYIFNFELLERGALAKLCDEVFK